MKYFAFYSNNNVVVQVLPVPDDANELDFARHVGMTCKETFKDQSSRGKFAGVGYNYVPDHDIFIPPQPFNSWTIDVDSADWVAPVDKPSDGGHYLWNEFKVEWEPSGINMSQADKFLSTADMNVLKASELHSDPESVLTALSEEGHSWIYSE